MKRSSVRVVIADKRLTIEQALAAFRRYRLKTVVRYDLMGVGNPYVITLDEAAPELADHGVAGEHLPRPQCHTGDPTAAPTGFTGLSGRSCGGANSLPLQQFFLVSHPGVGGVAADNGCAVGCLRRQAQTSRTRRPKWPRSDHGDRPDPDA